MRYFFILLFFPCFMFAQEFYFCSGPNHIYRVDENFDVELVSNFPVSDGVMTDISFSPNSVMYGITDDRKILRLELVSNSYQVL